MLLYNGGIRVCLGPPARPMGPKAPGGGKTPAPGSRVRTRWDPKPALGLAIRPVAHGSMGLGRGDPAGGCVLRSNVITDSGGR
jgi:hypothetical protein